MENKPMPKVFEESRLIDKLQGSLESFVSEFKYDFDGNIAKGNALLDFFRDTLHLDVDSNEEWFNKEIDRENGEYGSED